MVKTLAQGKADYIDSIQTAIKENKYLASMAEFLGLSEAEISNAGPVKSWYKEMQEHLNDYADKWARRMRLAYKPGGP